MGRDVTVTVEPYEGPERRWSGDAPRRLPRWALLLGLALVWLAIMGPLAVILRLGLRSDGRAERAGRTVCELTGGFNRALDLLDPDTRAVAEQGLRAPLDSAAELDARTREQCHTGPLP
jgi:hypothetical protein